MNHSAMRKIGQGFIILVVVAGGAFAAFRQMPAKEVTQTGVGVRLGVTVTGIANDKGSILGSVCDKASFLKQCAYGRIEKANTVGAVHLQFDKIPPGRYAVMVFHDENDNRHFDTAANGLPLEGYGFSRNAKGNYGPPEFDEAAIDVPAGGAEVAISLIY